MSGNDVSPLQLIERVATLERSLRRTRLGFYALLLLSLVLSTAAWRVSSEVSAEKVILTDDIGTQIMVLRGVDGVTGPSLVLETPGGRQVLLLGPAVRPIR
jgi:hypothetical protein